MSDFELLKHIAIGTSTLDYTYDSNHSRITQTSNTGDVTTYYNDPISGGGSEKLVSGGTTTWRDYIVASGHIVGIHNKTGNTVTWLYPAHDHLGSLTTLTKSDASLQEQQSYDALRMAPGVRRSKRFAEAFRPLGGPRLTEKTSQSRQHR